MTDVVFDLHSFSFANPDLFVDPYPTYQRMREKSSMHASNMYGGSLLAFGYEDAVTLLRGDLLTNNRAALPVLALPACERAEFAEFVDFLRTWTAFFEGDEHLLRRRRMDQVFRTLTPPVVSAIVREIAEDLLAGWPSHGTVDLVESFTRPLPSMVLTRLLGAPDEDHALLDDWAEDIAHVFGTNDLTADDLRRAQRSAAQLMQYLRDLAADLARLPSASILGGLVSRGGGKFDFSVAQACAQCVLLLFAGLEPSRHVIGSALLALERFPDQRALLAAEPSLWSAAAEEFLRLDAPVQYIGRLAARDFVYRGHQVQQGQAVLPIVGSANRDPARHRDPDVLDVRRRSGHLAMGEGVHRCIGAGMVRSQTVTALTTLLDRKPAVRTVAGIEPVWNSYVGFHGLRTLMVSP